MLAKSEKFKLPVILLIATFAVFLVNAQNTCTTARRQTPGLCVPVSDCRIINSGLRKYSRIVIDAYIQESLCGDSFEEAHVCCEKNYANPKNVSNENIDTGMRILSSTVCGKSSADRVANGDNASLQEFPWMALLVYDEQTTMKCAGSLITDRYVLTAAHCIHGLRIIRVRLGEYDTNTNPDCIIRGWKKKCAPPIQEIDVEEAIYHEHYNKARISNDIGLIRLARNAQINAAVKTICLPVTENSRNQPLPYMQIAGWGLLETGLTSSVLQKARICAGGNENIVSCRGDSGGPLFFIAPYRKGARYVQYGVISGGAFHCGSKYPSIFARVLSHMQWIAGNLRK